MSAVATAVSIDARTITRRPVAEGDEAFLLKVYGSTRAEEMALVPWVEAEKEAFLAGQLKAQKASYNAQFPDAAHEIILLEGEAVGQIWVGRSDQEIHLLDIALLPEFRGRGIGTHLLEELQRAAARHAKPMRHCVYKPNLSALAFYERLGFVVVGDLGMYHLMEWKASGPQPAGAQRKELE